MVTVKVFMTLQIDDEEYTMPADGRVDEELEEALQEMIYDIVTSLVLIPKYRDLIKNTKSLTSEYNTFSRHYREIKSMLS